jgi:hypothetical protein
VHSAAADLGATAADYFGVRAPRGESFLAQVLYQRQMRS